MHTMSLCFSKVSKKSLFVLKFSIFIVTIDVRLEEMSNSLSFLESSNFGPYPSALLRF